MAFTINSAVAVLFASFISLSPVPSPLPTATPTSIETPSVTQEETPKTWQEIVEPKFEELDKGFDGSLGIYIEDLENGEKVMHNADQKYYLASVIKLFVMTEIYKLIHEKKLAWTDSIRIADSKYRDGAGYINWLSPGNKVSIRELVQSMMNKSDNAATDILIDIGGLEKIHQTALEYGVTDMDKIVNLLDVRKAVFRNLHPLGGQLTALDFIELWKIKNFDRKLKLFSKLINRPDIKFTEGDLSKAFDEFFKTGTNSASLISVAEFLKKLAKGELVSEKISKDMIELLKRCETGENRIKKGMPSGFEFAHKTGTQYKRVCDVGIAFGPNQKLLILMCAIDFKNREIAEETLFKASEQFFNAYMNATMQDLPIVEPIPKIY